MSDFDEALRVLGWDGTPETRDDYVFLAGMEAGEMRARAEILNLRLELKEAQLASAELTAAEAKSIVGRINRAIGTNEQKRAALLRVAEAARAIRREKGRAATRKEVIVWLADNATNIIVSERTLARYKQILAPIGQW